LSQFAEGEFRNLLNFTTSDNQTNLIRQLLTKPGAILMSQELAESLSLSVGDTIELIMGGEKRPALLIGNYLPAPSQAAIFRNILITDIASAQDLLQREGRLSRIDLILDGPLEINAIQPVLSEGTRLLEANSRSLVMRGMTRAFSLNLTAMSLLALVVGMFLIYNSISFSVLQRREQLGRPAHTGSHPS